MHQTDTNHARADRSPLWATLALTWVDNIGAFAALGGVYFVAQVAYDMPASHSLGMGLVQGVAYIAGALTAGAGSRLVTRGGTRMSTRTMLIGLHVLLAAVCWLPVLWRSPASLWAINIIYGAMAGWLWPIIESFLSAGRTGDELRKSSGWFNLSWASCQVVVAWAMGPILARDPLWVIPLMGLSHIGAIALVCMLTPNPAPHGEGSHEHSPTETRRFKALLAPHRTLLVMSYLVYACLNPLIPALVAALNVLAPWSTVLASTWAIARVASFWMMGRWGGWHGRAITLVWPGALLLCGFALALLATSVPVFAAALVLFGVGLGATYSAAFYYAMEVGSAGVDAGGKHEAMIGLGYTMGPIAGLVAAQAATRVAGDPVAPAVASGDLPRTATVLVVIGLAVVFCGIIAAQLRRGLTRPQ